MDEREARAGRVAQAMDGRSIAWLSSSVGVALSTAHSYVHGAVPPADVAIRIAEALGVDFRWYVIGDGTAARADGGFVHVPLVDSRFSVAGSMPFSLDLLAGLGADPAGVKCILPPGAAMRPSVPENAEVLYGPMPPQGADDGRVYVLSVSGRAVVRRVRLATEGFWEAICDNPAFRLEPKERIPDGAFAGEVLWVSHRP